MMQQQKQTSITVFYSYAPADRKWRDQFATHLSQLKREGLIEEWHDQDVLAGSEWEQEINEHLNTANLILLLVSPDFLASDACYQIEMQQALERHRRGEARVIPIIVRPCDWQHSPFAHLQCLPRSGKPIAICDSQDEAFLLIAQELRRIIAERQFPLPSLSNLERQNRIRLLNRVRATWIEGLLEQSLHRAAWIDLHLRDQPDALENPWRFQVQELGREPHPLPIGTSILQVYDEADGKLLILGEPGSGKTTLLLHLARTLLKHAEADECLPVPVVFNLSSWAKLRQPLTVWLVEELKSNKYQVPQRIAQQWIETNQILPLLDGLDEVTAEARMACVEAITAYYTHQSNASLVVCCRSEEYRVLSLRLPLQRAVHILPLTKKQIDEYLSSAQGQLEGLQQALGEDLELSKLARQPLMLNIFTLAYQGVAATELPMKSTYEQTLRTVLGKYIVQRMLLRRGQLHTWKQEQFLHWLYFLAKQLHPQQQTIFSVEDLQPDWLSGVPQRLYWPSVRLFTGLVGGLVFGLVAWLVFGQVFGQVLGLFFGLGNGLAFGLLAGLAARGIIGLVFGLLLGPIFGLPASLLAGLATKRVARLAVWRGDRIRPTEEIDWSWKKGLLGLLIGLTVMPTAGVLIYKSLLPLPGELLPFWLITFLLVGLLTGVLIGLAIGLSPNQLTERTHLSPNEGIWRSGKKGLFLGLLAVPVSGLLLGLFFRLSAGSLFGTSAGLPFGLYSGLYYGLYYGLPIGLVSGLSAFIQHFVLRFWLWRTSRLPWHLVPFLDEAAERLFLRKLGGSYIFVHRLLLDYLATYDEPVSTENTSPESKV